MCGICGKLNFSSRQVAPETLANMNAALLHRGPDEYGSYHNFEKNFGMAMRRLRVIDLATGSQPIFNEDGNVAVVLNGEIYNYIELRQDLEKRGHTFKTRSDTETLVHGYEVYGVDFFQQLNGMFAFAIWDDARKKLIVARDRMGIKPLYYRQDAAGFSFASEIKALLADPDCPKEMDLAALDDYFSLLYVPGPRSAFKAIRKLEPGHYLICDAKTGSIQNQAYWKRPLPRHFKDQGLDFYLGRLDELFADALKLQLRSDVPNGLFLSSGLDSAAIAYYAAKAAAHQMNSFTVDFDDKSYSESDGARKIAAMLGLKHHELELKPDVQDIILKTAEFFDEPFADTSAIPTYLLTQSAKKHITVALSGEGGDELFAGYPTYIATRWAGLYRGLPSPLRKIAAGAANSLPISWNRISLDYKLRQFVRGAEETPERSHFAWKEIFTEEDKKELYSAQWLKARNGKDGFESFKILFDELGGGTELEKLLYVDQKTYLLDQFLVKSDRMSMAHALEVRVPILDHRLVEFAAEIPAHYKIRGLTTKWILRRLMKGRLPEEILTGAKKGFSPPIPRWIAGPLKPFVQEMLSESSVKKTGLIEPAFVKRILEEHWERKQDHHRRIWAILNFVLWHRRWVA